jgi:hypothetical protein
LKLRTLIGRRRNITDNFVNPRRHKHKSEETKN